MTGEICCGGWGGGGSCLEVRALEVFNANVAVQSSSLRSSPNLTRFPVEPNHQASSVNGIRVVISCGEGTISPRYPHVELNLMSNLASGNIIVDSKG